MLFAFWQDGILCSFFPGILHMSYLNSFSLSSRLSVHVKPSGSHSHEWNKWIDMRRRSGGLFVQGDCGDRQWAPRPEKEKLLKTSSSSGKGVTRKWRAMPGFPNLPMMPTPACCWWLPWPTPPRPEGRHCDWQHAFRPGPIVPYPCNTVDLAWYGRGRARHCWGPDSVTWSLPHGVVVAPGDGCFFPSDRHFPNRQVWKTDLPDMFCVPVAWPQTQSITPASPSPMQDIDMKEEKTYTWQPSSVTMGRALLIDPAVTTMPPFCIINN